jgi:polar amino acid transport system substrate-binding protein
MLSRFPARYLVILVFFAAPALFAFVACGGEEEEEATPPAETPAAAETPMAEAICNAPDTGTPVEGVAELEDGTLTIGSDIAYAPIEFFEAGSDVPVGVDIDIGECLGEELGVAVEWLDLGFDPLIPSIEQGQIDAIMSAMTVTAEREERIDFIPYFTAGTGILVRAGNPEGIQSVDDLCGLGVAAQEGTIQEDQLRTLNDTTCADNAIDIQVFDQNPLAVEQLRVGGAAAVLADFPVVVNDALQSEGELEVAGDQFEAEPYGIGLRKDSTALNDALTGALVSIIDDGRYDQILAKWSAEAGAYKEVAGQ